MSQRIKDNLKSCINYAAIVLRVCLPTKLPIVALKVFVKKFINLKNIDLMLMNEKQFELFIEQLKQKILLKGQQVLKHNY
jgi:predicted GH43/DUF377 family glycosyl hydrolase